MDENKDAVVDELAEESATDAVEEAVEQASDQAAFVEDTVETDEPEAPEVLEDAVAPEAEKEVEIGEAEEIPEEAEAEEAEESGEEAEVKEVKSEIDPAAVEAPAAPAKKASPYASTADLLIVGIIAIIMGVLLALPSFLGMTSQGEKETGASGGVAATVNGVAISEDEVTKYVTDFRASQGLESDESWGTWMVSYGYTAEDLRSDTVDYFVNRELLKQAIAEQGIQVEDAKVDEYIASITEQVGGEEAFNEALKGEGLDLDTYREEVLFSLQQQALAEQVVADKAKVDDDQVLEIVKMYFPDSVDEKATTLDGVDKDTIEQVRSMLESSALQQAFSEWLEEYRSKANVVIVEMPKSLPYAIDLTPYEEAANQASQSDGGEDVDVDVAESDEADASEGSASAQSK